MSPDAQWSLKLFNSLSEGGVWGVPRSGLIFAKRKGLLVMITRMPHDPAMPITEAQLQEQQMSDFEAIREKFAEAGIPVIEEKQS